MHCLVENTPSWAGLLTKYMKIRANGSSSFIGLIRVLAHGREMVKVVDRLCLLVWDPDYQGVRIKDVHLRLDAFKQFVQDGIKSTETMLREQLFFGMDLPTIDSGTINDIYENVEPDYSFLKGSADILLNGREFM